VYKPRDMSVLELMAPGRVLWLEAKTYDNVSISIVNVDEATAKRHDLQRQFTYLLREMIDAALTCNEVETGGHGIMGWGPAASTLKDMPVRTQHARF